MSCACLMALLLVCMAQCPLALASANGNQPPVASALVIGAEGASKTAWTYAGMAVQFTAVGSYDPDGRIVKYAWDFGDNSSLFEGVNATHVYNAPGTYMAMLNVTDDAGASSSDACLVFVRESPYTLMAKAFNFGILVASIVVFSGWIFFKVVGRRKPYVFKPGFPKRKQLP